MLPVAEADKTWLAGRDLTFCDVRVARPGHVRFLPRIGAGVDWVPSPASNTVDFGTEVVPLTAVPIGITSKRPVDGPVGP